MPRANIAAIEAWREEFRAQRRMNEAQSESFVQHWSTLIIVLALLYMFMGTHPFQHGVVVDAETGGAAVSPVNRYIWMLLGGLCLPVLWRRRERLIPALKTLWVLIALYVWFFATTTWALDPVVANRRLFLYIINLVIAVALALGFEDTRKFHRALAIGCLIMIWLDVASLSLPSVSRTDLGLVALHGQKNQLGLAMMVCGVVIGPLCLAPPNPRYRWLWVTTFLAGLGMLIASQSRTSLSIMLVTMSVTPLLLIVLSLRPLVIQAIGLTIVMIVFLFLLGWLVWCTAQGLDPLAPLQGINFSQRTDLWVFVAGEILKRPLTGSGFGSFWDISPLLQPSLNNDLWFGSPDIANQAHNGYLDLLVTTGVFGLGGALFILFRWMIRGMARIRRALLSPVRTVPAAFYPIVAFSLFPTLIFVHNFMESSYFTANALLGALLLMVGVDIDLADAAWRASRR